MSTQLKLRRGTTAQHSTFTGAEGEVTVDTTKDTLVVHDGTTAGGVPLSKESDLTSGLAGKQASSTALTAISAQNGVNAFKNRIINGDMRIDQRNAGASVTPNNSYIVDRWTFGNSQTGKFNGQQNAGAITPPAGFSNYLGFTSTSAYSLTTTDEFEVIYRNEGFNTSDFGWGAANAKPVTLSFWVQSSLTGTFGGVLNNAKNSTPCYIFSYSITTANTWTQISITIPGVTTGTWDIGNLTSVQLLFSLGAGSTLLGATGSWGSTFLRGPTGQVNVAGTSGATFYITGVQLEKGSTATSFDYRDYGRELIMCQRYYFRWTNTAASTRELATLQAYSTTSVFGKLLDFPVSMRALPTCTASGTFQPSNSSGTLQSAVTVALQPASLTSVSTGSATGSSGLTAGNASVLYAGVGAYIDASAEL